MLLYINNILKRRKSDVKRFTNDMSSFSIANLVKNSASELNSDLVKKNPEPHISVGKWCSKVIELNKHTVFSLIRAPGAYLISKM